MKSLILGVAAGGLLWAASVSPRRRREHLLLARPPHHRRRQPALPWLRWAQTERRWIAIEVQRPRQVTAIRLLRPPTPMHRHLLRALTALPWARQSRLEKNGFSNVSDLDKGRQWRVAGQRAKERQPHNGMAGLQRQYRRRQVRRNLWQQRTLSCMYDNYDDAKAVVHDLEASGVPHSEISLIANADAHGRSSGRETQRR